MNVPIEVVRAGKSEEYVAAHYAMMAAYHAAEEAKKAHGDAILELWGVLKSEAEVGSTGRVTVWGNRWKFSLLLEAVSKKVVEAAGLVAEAELENKKASDRFSQINERWAK